MTTLETVVWRGVHVEIPHNGQRVLVYMPKAAAWRVTIADYSLGSWCELGGRMLDGALVTYWGDLPTGAD